MLAKLCGVFGVTNVLKIIVPHLKQTQNRISIKLYQKQSILS